ncbi:MAG: hypothetical protein ACUVQK_15705, partial [Thermogutta sp.]
DHRGTTEWAEYRWATPVKLSAAEVYWFDDEPTGGRCRVPASWRLLYLDGGEWRPVRTDDEFGLQKDAFNRVRFSPVETTGLRLEVRLRDDFSGGILEWRVE